MTNAHLVVTTMNVQSHDSSEFTRIAHTRAQEREEGDLTHHMHIEYRIMQGAVLGCGSSVGATVQ